MPPRLMADLQLVQVAEAGAKGIGVAAGVKIAAKTAGKTAAGIGSRANIIGLLAWAAWTMGSTAKNKQKNVNFADRIRTRVEADAARLETQLRAGGVNPAEAAARYNKMVELTRASEMILKAEQDKVMGKELTDVDDKMIEVQFLLKEQLPGIQRLIEQGIIRPAPGVPTAGVPV